MKSIPLDIDTMSIVAANLSRADVGLVSYDGEHASGPDIVIDRIAALDLAALRKAALIDYAAGRRFTVETGGLTVGGVAVATDRQSQAMLNAAFNLASSNAEFSTMWKGANGAFTSLSAAQIIAVAQAVGAFVGACFGAEAAVVAGINAGTITSRAQIDAAIVVA